MISRKGYYSIVDLKFEIIHQLKHRETMFIPYDDDNKASAPIRWLNASFIKMLEKHWDYFNFLDRKMNLYHSLATYKDFPTFAYNWGYKSQQQKIWLDRFQEYVTKYDFFLETDSEDLNLSIKDDGMKIKAFLDEYKVKYSIRFSGSKGLHFLVPYEEFSHIDLPVVDVKGVYFDLVKLFKMIALRIKGVLGCDTVDTTVFDVKRVCKVAYSWDVKSNLIAYPLDDDQLKNFSKDMVRPEVIIKKNNHKRGLIYRNCDVTKETRQKSILKMIEDLDIDLEKFK